MKKSRYTDEQIAFALKQAETGTPVAEVIRRMGLSRQVVPVLDLRHGVMLLSAVVVAARWASMVRRTI